MSVIEKRLRPVWRRWHGVIPVWAAEQAGVRPDNLRRWANGNPDVDHPSKGVYIWYPDDEGSDAEVGSDWRLVRFAKALAEAGPGARLWGPSVLEAAHLGSVGGGNVCIEVPKRRRRRDGVTWIVSPKTGGSPETVIKGLPAQRVYDALECAIRMIDSDKFDEALASAKRRRLIGVRQYEGLNKQRRLQAA